MICNHCGNDICEPLRWVHNGSFEGCRSCWCKAGRPTRLPGFKPSRDSKERFRRKCRCCKQYVTDAELWDDELNVCLQPGMLCAEWAAELLNGAMCDDERERLLKVKA